MTPEAVVQAFADALNKQDFAAAAKLVSGGSVDPTVVRGVGREPLPKFTLSGVSSSVIGEYALVTFHIKLNDSPEKDDYLVLIRKGGDWLIDPPVRDNGLGFSALMLSSVPMMTNARTAAKSTTCLSNAKQLALAAILLEGDNDDVLKVTAANWIEKLKPYMRNMDLLRCPEDAFGPVSYSLNPKLLGKSMAAVDQPATTVLLYEGKDGHLVFRHNGRAAVAFTDGHAKLVSEAEAKTLRWNP
jgi:prepilin-type processing-associated H-X9-DG protein